MPTRDVVPAERREALIETCEAGESGKLAALRAAAILGVSALDRGGFKEFTDASALEAHLDKIADRIVSGAGGQ